MLCLRHEVGDVGVVGTRLLTICHCFMDVLRSRILASIVLYALTLCEDEAVPLLLRVLSKEATRICQGGVWLHHVGRGTGLVLFASLVWPTAASERDRRKHEALLAVLILLLLCSMVHLAFQASLRQRVLLRLGVRERSVLGLGIAI